MKTMAETEAIGVIADAAPAHRGTGANNQDIAANKPVVVLIDRICAGENSIGRS